MRQRTRGAVQKGSNRVKRGGSWNNDDAQNFRAANRNNNDPAKRNDNRGFRLALAPAQQGPGADRLLNRAVSCPWEERSRGEERYGFLGLVAGLRWRRSQGLLF